MTPVSATQEAISICCVTCIGICIGIFIRIHGLSTVFFYTNCTKRMKSSGTVMVTSLWRYDKGLVLESFPEKAVEQTVMLAVIWNDKTRIGLHCNEVANLRTCWWPNSWLIWAYLNYSYCFNGHVIKTCFMTVGGKHFFPASAQYLLIKSWNGAVAAKLKPFSPFASAV